MNSKLLSSLQNGFWLNKNVFLKCNSVSIVLAERRDPLSGVTVKEPMLILIEVAEVTVDGNNRIVAVEWKEKLGLWKDVVELAL